MAYFYYTWLKTVMGGVGIFLQHYCHHMCKRMHQALRMPRTPRFLLAILDVISLAASWMQLWWWLVHR
jgi:hypothetical protein